jgi:hypothetical protein
LLLSTASAVRHLYAYYLKCAQGNQEKQTKPGDHSGNTTNISLAATSIIDIKKEFIYVTFE